MASPSVSPTLRTERLLLEQYVPEDEEALLFGRIFTKVYAQDLFDVWGFRRDGLLVGQAEIKPTDAAGGHENLRSGSGGLGVWPGKPSRRKRSWPMASAPSD